MFNGFKKDKITKLVQKEKDNLYNDLKNNNINLLEAHYIMEDNISKIYNENQFYYQDILNRKRYLTSFRDNTNNILISLLYGILGSGICSFILEASEVLSGFGTIICSILMLVIISIIAYFVLKSIFNTAVLLSDKDLYNVDAYELNIIENILQEYEDKK